MNASLARLLCSLQLIGACALILTGCGGAAASPPRATATPASTLRASSMPSPATTATSRPVASTRAPTRTPGPTLSAPAPTKTPLPSATPAASPLSPPAYIGTPVPPNAGPIGVANIAQLTRVAQWGRGSILGVAFAPDGHTFIAGSAHGLAVYDRQHLDRSLRWIPFDPPVWYTTLAFSEDGQYLKLETGRSGPQVRRLADGQVVPYPRGAHWFKTTERMTGGTLLSPDRTKRFTASVVYTGDGISVREVYDNRSGELLYRLPDETTYVRYWDYHEPEGCDLDTFSYCGNVYEPSVMVPYEAGFAPSERYLSVLYRAQNLWNSNEFSALRVYDAANGAPLVRIGSFAEPVEAFAYSPDGSALVVGYVDGSVRLWDLERRQSVFSAWHFNAPIIDMAYTASGRYLLVQTRGWLQVRRASDGLLLARYPNSAFAVSPVEDLLAIGTIDGHLQVQDLAAVQRLYDIPAHHGKIYALAFSPDGQLLTSSGADCDVRSWRVRTGEFLHLFEENTTDAYGLGDTASRIFVQYMQFIPGTNQLLGFGSWARLVSWNVNSGATQYFIEPDALEYYQGMVTLNPHFPGSFGVDVQNSRFYIEAMGYDLRTGAEVGEYQMPAGLPADCAPAGAISTDGTLLITRGYGSNEGLLCVLGARDRRMLRALGVVTGDMQIGWPNLSPDGRQLAVATEGGAVYVYQVVISPGHP